MTIPRNLACKDGLVYVPKHSRRTCCQSRYERPYMHHKVIFLKGEDLLAFILAVQLYECHQLSDY